MSILGMIPWDNLLSVYQLVKFVLNLYGIQLNLILIFNLLHSFIEFLRKLYNAVENFVIYS